MKREIRNPASGLEGRRCDYRNAGRRLRLPFDLVPSAALHPQDGGGADARNLPPLTLAA